MPKATPLTNNKGDHLRVHGRCQSLFKIEVERGVWGGLSEHTGLESDGLCFFWSH